MQETERMEARFVDKPLREWTMGECREFHRKRLEEFSGEAEKACDDCPLCGVCAIPADDWDLSDIFRLTRAEREILRPFIKEGARWLSRDKGRGEKIYLWAEKPQQDPAGYFVGKNPSVLNFPTLFPSVRPGDCWELEERG